jgi:hypothetical protein
MPGPCQISQAWDLGRFASFWVLAPDARNRKPNLDRQPAERESPNSRLADLSHLRQRMRRSERLIAGPMPRSKFR